MEVQLYSSIGLQESPHPSPKCQYYLKIHHKEAIKGYGNTGWIDLYYWVGRGKRALKGNTIERGGKIKRRRKSWIHWCWMWFQNHFDENLSLIVSQITETQSTKTKFQSHPIIKKDPSSNYSHFLHPCIINHHNYFFPEFRRWMCVNKEKITFLSFLAHWITCNFYIIFSSLSYWRLPTNSHRARIFLIATKIILLPI